MVVVTALIALLLAIQGSNALANLALLTFSGLSQLVPSIVAALRRSGPVIHAWSAVAGLVAGVAVVATLTFTSLAVGTWNVGVIGLGVNIVVVAIVEAVLRASRGAPLPHQPVSTGGVA
jgi:SSS family solute:Na+ symporter